MLRRRLVAALAAMTASTMVLGSVPAAAAVDPSLLASLDIGGAETVTYDAMTQLLFVSNADEASMAVVDLSDPTNPVLVESVPMSPYGGGVTSVDSSAGLVVMGVTGATPQDPGAAVFFDATTREHVATVPTGALPDAVKFTPDGSMVVTTNEGEPNADYTVDPEGSLTVIPIVDGVPGTPTTIGFEAFTSQQADLVAAGLRLFGPGASLVQDLEPEYVAFTDDSATAYVTLQENNAIAVVDLTVPVVTAIVPLGYKDHSVAGNEIDASDRDELNGNFQLWPVQGMYLPDQIATVNGYIISANEGDSRDYDTFTEETRVADMTLDPEVFPNAADLQAESALGRLLVSTVNSDVDGDGNVDVLYSYGGRSISVWGPDGSLVWDSGSELERAVLELTPEAWDDGRSDNKGPEPEGVVTGEVDGSVFAYVALERTSGIAVWDMTDPTAPVFTTILQPPADTDVSPEGMVFIAAQDSPNGQPLLAVANEVSGTLAVWAVGPMMDIEDEEILPTSGAGITLGLMGVALVLGGLAIGRRRTL